VPFFHEKLEHLERKKFDMRIFFLVTYEPKTEDMGASGVPWLRAYLHQDGVCRFSTADYDIDDLSEENRRAHLTNNALNKDAANYKPGSNLISMQASSSDSTHRPMTSVPSLQDLERLMPKGWSLKSHFYPYVQRHICSALACHVASGLLPRKGFQLFGIDLMFVKPEDPREAYPSIYLLEVNLRPKLDIPDQVSVQFKNEVKAIVDDVIECVEKHHATAPPPEGAKPAKRTMAEIMSEFDRNKGAAGKREVMQQASDQGPTPVVPGQGGSGGRENRFLEVDFTEHFYARISSELPTTCHWGSSKSS
jgi:hypothetical protein